MARRVLIVGAAAWLALGLVAIALAIAGTGSLLALLPPLAIDAEALGGALLAMGLALVVIGVGHIVVLAGLRRRQRWAMSAAALLASVLAVVSLGLAATAASSAMRQADSAPPLIGAACVGVASTVGYALAAARLARELGSGSPS